MGTPGHVACAYSFERVTKTDLRRLAALALDYFDALFEHKPYASGRFQGRLLLLALCQGAALHYVDGSHGLKTSMCGASLRRCRTCHSHLEATVGATSGALASVATLTMSTMKAAA